MSSIVYSPDYRFIVKASKGAYWRLDTMLSCDATLVTQQGVGQLQAVFADPVGYIGEQVGLHPMQVCQLWIKNRWGKWGKCWTGYIDAVHRQFDPNQGDMVQIMASSPIKLWEIQTINSSSAVKLALASAQNVAASRILRMSAQQVGYTGQLNIDPIADGGTGYQSQGIATAFTSPEAQTWSSVVQAVLGSTGLEWFFDEGGDCHWRPVGFQTPPKGGVYRPVLEDELISADLAETDASVVTRVQVRYPGTGDTQFTQATAVAPSAMADHLRERYIVVDAPWIISNAQAAQWLAEVLLEQAAANVLVGTISLPADPGFQIGTLCEVPALLRTPSSDHGRSDNPPGGVTRYYITSITYQLQWTGTWVMTLGLGYGRAPGQSFPYLSGKGQLVDDTGKATSTFSLNEFPAATYSRSGIAADNPLLNTKPENPNALLDVFTVTANKSLKTNQVQADPQIFPPGSVLLLKDTHGHPLDSDNHSSDFTVVAGTAGQDLTISVHDTTSSKAMVTIVKLVDPPPSDDATGTTGGAANDSADSGSLTNRAMGSSTAVADHAPPLQDGSLPLKALAAAYNLLGQPYVFSEAGPNGWDCSGLVAWSYHVCGADWFINLAGNFNTDAGPNGIYTIAQQHGAKKITVDAAQPGDLLFTFFPPGQGPGYCWQFGQNGCAHIGFCYKAGGLASGQSLEAWDQNHGTVILPMNAPQEASAVFTHALDMSGVTTSS